MATITVTEAPKAVIVGTSSQRIADCLTAIDVSLQSARKRQRADDADTAGAEDDTLEFREQQLRGHLHTLSEHIVSFGAQLVPVAERIGRTIVSAVVTRQVPLNESWEAAALFCAYFPTAGAAILTELFEQFLQTNTFWMPTLLGLQYAAVTPRVDALADMIAASVQYVEASLAQRFATLFTSEATDIAIWRRSNVMGGQTVLCLPHAVNNVFTALLMGLRPCPPSVVAEVTDRVSGVRGHSYSLHATFPKPPVAANKAPSFRTGGSVGGHATNSDSLQLAPLPLPFLGAYKLAQESSVRLRAALSQVLHPRSQPFYQPPTTTVVDIWPVPAAAVAPTAAAVAAPAVVAEETVVVAAPSPAVAPTATAAASAAAPADTTTNHPALGGSAPVATKAPVASAPKPKSPKQQPVVPKTAAPAAKLEDLPDIEF